MTSPITHPDPFQQKIIDRVCSAEQEHVFRFWSGLDEQQRQSLLNQLAGVDFELLADLHRRFIKSGDGGQFQGKLEPAEFIHLPKNEEERAAFARAKTAGEEALSAGKVAAFLVAGGQGTRLGFPGPKGKYPISPIKNKTLFQLHAEKILAKARRFNTTIPWYIMTSQSNHAETVAFFEENRFFGLQPSDVMFFEQEMIPALDQNGRVLLDCKGHIFCNPNGHGGSLSALRKSGALEDMKRRGIETIFYFQVDNVLGKICDAVFIGFHILEAAEMSAKIVVKKNPEEKVGVFGRVDGKLGVIEYSDLSAAEKAARNPDGSLKFQAGSIAIHIFNRDFVERETRHGLRLPWHVAHKVVPFIDARGELVTPEAPNAFKFETFVFDALADARKATILEVSRRDEFSPVKNAEGDNSPEGARRDMRRQFQRWLEEAGAMKAGAKATGDIEISPLFALDADELKARFEAGFEFTGQSYIG